MEPQLGDYDFVIINSSSGKDSQTILCPAFTTGGGRRTARAGAISRRRFLKAGLLWLPSGAIAAPSLSFFGKAKGNGLLNGLVAYWKLDDSQFTTRVDSIGANNLTDRNSNFGDTAHNSLTAVINGGAYNGGQANAQLFHTDNATLGAGSAVSFFFSAWCWTNNARVAGSPFIAKWGAAGLDYLLEIDSPTTLVSWYARNLANNAQPVIQVTMGTMAWHHFVVGYDDIQQQSFLYFDGGAKQTISCVGVQRTSANFVLGNFSDTNAMSGQSTMAMDEIGLWKRVPTAADVGSLYNGGAGLPLGSFT